MNTEYQVIADLIVKAEQTKDAKISWEASQKAFQLLRKLQKDKKAKIEEQGEIEKDEPRLEAFRSAKADYESARELFSAEKEMSRKVVLELSVLDEEIDLIGEQLKIAQSLFDKAGFLAKTNPVQMVLFEGLNQYDLQAKMKSKKIGKGTMTMGEFELKLKE